MYFFIFYSPNRHYYTFRCTRKTISGEWKKGSVILKNGDVLEGQVKGFTYTGNDLKNVKYRKAKGESAEKYSADDVNYITWDQTYILSLPKNFKKPQKGNRLYTAIYSGKHITVLFDPNANVAEPGLNAGEALNVLVLKDNMITKVTKMKFKKQLMELCKDNDQWHNKVMDKANKKWYNYSNIFEVVKDYDTTK